MKVPDKYCKRNCPIRNDGFCQNDCIIVDSFHEKVHRTLCRIIPEARAEVIESCDFVYSPSTELVWVVFVTDEAYELNEEVARQMKSESYLKGMPPGWRKPKEDDP